MLIRVISIDSVMNCHIRLDRCAPITFLIPISLARVVDWAVVRLMKLRQAMVRIRKATTTNAYTCLAFPFTSISADISDLRCISNKGMVE